jgi:hypothetical protein
MDVTSHEAFHRKFDLGQKSKRKFTYSEILSIKYAESMLAQMKSRNGGAPYGRWKVEEADKRLESCRPSGALSRHFLTPSEEAGCPQRPAKSGVLVPLRSG